MMFGPKPLPFLFSIVIGIGMWLLPTPAELSPQAWQMLAIFLFTICGIITKALPMGGMALLSLATVTFTRTLPISDALSGFGNPIVWLIFSAFFVAKSFIKTGLGFRIAYMLVASLGHSSLGLAYGMAAADLVLAPAIPSTTARGGGIIYPVLKSLALIFDSSPEQKTERRIGAYLIQSAYQCNIITSAMFMTAMAANPLIAEMAGEMGIEITWGSWALAAIVPGLLSLIIVPWVLYKIYPPEITDTTDAVKMAQGHLKEIGKMKPQEWITLGVFFLLLILWIFRGIPYLDLFTMNFAIYESNSTTTAILGVAILLLMNILDWQDIVEEKSAWGTVFWFAVLMMLAAQLNQLGVIEWISDSIRDSVVDIYWVTAYAILLIGYFYSHYLFASTTAQASSMFAATTIVGITAGVPPTLMALSLAFASNLSACLTHYGTAPGPILYGSGYVELRDWWKLGAIMSLMYFVIWFGIGPLWWSVLG